MAVTANRSFDPLLLARMTGQLGDTGSIDSCMAALGQSMAEFLPEETQRTAGVDAAVTLAATPQGNRMEMTARFTEEHVLCEAVIEGWCNDIVLALDSSLAITATESLLGGGSGTSSASRPLSGIEQDVAQLLLKAFAQALGRTVSESMALVSCAPAFIGPMKRKTDASQREFCAIMALSVTLGDNAYAMQALLPQHIVLKTKPVRPLPAPETERPKHWTEQLSDKVHKSHVGLEARIGLKSMTLETVGRLQPGSVIPFADEKDVRVLLSANGKDLFWCEMGKSGERYMVRLQERHGSEEDFMRELAG